MELVKSWLETAQANNVLLAGRMGALMVRMLDIKDAVMSDAKGEPSDSSSDVDPVENVVAIPVLAPSVIHTCHRGRFFDSFSAILPPNSQHSLHSTFSFPLTNHPRP